MGIITRGRENERAHVREQQRLPTYA